MGEPGMTGRCDVCGKDKPIVLICLIGDRLCGECQEEQKRISYCELTEETYRAFKEAMLPWEAT
jgi:hypothetical protein